MKVFLMAAVISFAVSAQAKHQFAGSDTLAGLMTDAIIQAGMDQAIAYSGGGSGLGEKGLATGDQGIAPMSRELKADVAAQLDARFSL